MKYINNRIFSISPQKAQSDMDLLSTLRNLLSALFIIVAISLIPYAVSADPQADTDGDGVPLGPVYIPIGVSDITIFIPISDNCPNTPNPSQANADGDAFGDACDLFPNDASEWADNDGDGIGDNADPDDDNDGVADVNDAFPFDANEWQDTDGDGIGNVADQDDDNDGIPDSVDLNPLVADTEDMDADGDGYSNLVEYLSGTDANNSSDYPHDNVGFTPGKLSVDASGGANYTIPIVVPPGTAGMKPSLSLNYNSHGGNGLLGVGWTLGGLSAISRCPATLAQDNYIDTVDFDSSDQLCLDGKRLLLVGSGTDSDGSYTEYRTEIDIFSRVKAYGSVGAGGGPVKIKVEAKSGQTLYYGWDDTNYHSRIQAQGRSDGAVLVWAVDKIKDPAGNYLTVTYTENTTNGEYRPDKIDYTGNTGLTPYAQVKFEYEAKTYINPQYVGGSLVKQTQRLKNIKTYVDNVLVKNYVLSYGISGASGKERLASLKECSDNSANNCFEPTTLDWKSETSNFQIETYIPPVVIRSYQNSTVPGSQEYGTLVDVNGDGKVDIVRNTIARDGSTLIGTYINNGNGWVRDPSKFADPPVTLMDYQQTTVPGGQKFGDLVDVNGDGLVDIVRSMITLGGNTVVGTYINTGSGWVRNTSVFADLQIRLRTYQDTSVSGAQELAEFADVNGDGLVDVVAYTVKRNSNTIIGTYINTGSGWTRNTNVFPDPPTPLRSYQDTTVPGGQKFADLVDINGDGMADIVTRTVKRNGNELNTVFLSNGSGWYQYNNYNLPQTFRSYLDSTVPGGQQFGDFVDVNGDGLLDLVYGVVKRNTNTLQSTFLNTGDGWHNDSNYRLPEVIRTYQDTSVPGPQQLGEFVDVNGDGLVDMALSVVKRNGVQILRTHLNTGNGWSSVNNNYTLPSYVRTYSDTSVSGGEKLSEFGDANGDGVLDVITSVRQRNQILTRSVGTANSAAPDMMDTVISGKGDQTDIIYAPITDNTIYSKGNSAVYPDMDIQMPMYVVDTVTVDNGIGGTRSTLYSYAGARVNLWGRGFLGFAAKAVKDSGTGITTTTNYRQTFPYVGMVSQSEQQLSDNTLIGKVTSGAASLATAGNAVFPYANTVSEYNNEIDGSAVTTTTTTTSYSSYGNPTNITVTTTGGGKTFTTTTINTYTDDTTNWHLGRLTRATVTKTQPGDSATRVSSFTYYSQGLLKTETIEPDIASLKLVTTYAYDGFGNRTSATTTGGSGTTAIVSRTATTTYDSRGQFAISASNALNQTETRTWNKYFGVVDTLTGPNNIKTKWEYDSFGRVKKETQGYQSSAPINTYTIRLWCDSSCPGSGVNKLLSYTSGKATSIAYTDILGREIRTESAGFDGTPIYVDTQYDSLGRVLKKSRAYFSSDTPKWSTFTYDVLGRVLTETTPANAVTTTQYNGLSVTVENARSQYNTRVNNARGEMVQSVNEIDPNDPNKDLVTTYDYDPFGNLITVTDPNLNSINNTYDIRGNKTSSNDPDMGYWTYQYDALGELISQTDAKAQTISMQYDKLGRLISRTEAEGTSQWVYDSASHGIGKLASASGAEGETKTYLYDFLGRPSDTTTTIDGTAYTVSQTYDSAGRVNSITYPASAQHPLGFTVNHVYSSSGYLTEVRNADSGFLYWRLEDMTAEGQLKQALLGNGVRTQKTYDVNTGLIATIRSNSPIGVGDIQDTQYEFDQLGNLTRRDNFINGAYETFHYDGLNRMDKSTLFNGSQSTVTDYGYDDLGNLTSKTGIGSYSYGGGSAGPHAVTSAGSKTMSYDANGNMTTGWNFTNYTSRTITWTSYNKAKQISDGGGTLTFYYGADRARFKQTGNGRTIYYVGGIYEKEVDGSTVTNINYIRAGGEAIAIYKTIESSSGSPQAEETRYLHKDHLGSITEITDENAMIVEKMSYDPLGKRRNAMDWSKASYQLYGYDTRRGFTGHEMLDDVGIIHMNGRIYDPDLGRMLSPDPYVQFPSYSQSYNRYSYALNNPLSFVDPSGYGVFGFIADALDFVADSFVDFITDTLKSIFSPQNLLRNAVVALSFFACGPAGPYCAAAANSGFEAANGGSILDIALVAVSTFNTFNGIQSGTGSTGGGGGPSNGEVISMFTSDGGGGSGPDTSNTSFGQWIQTSLAIGKIIQDRNSKDGESQNKTAAIMVAQATTAGNGAVSRSYGNAEGFKDEMLNNAVARLKKQILTSPVFANDDLRKKYLDLFDSLNIVISRDPLAVLEETSNYKTRTITIRQIDLVRKYVNDRLEPPGVAQRRIMARLAHALRHQTPHNIKLRNAIPLGTRQRALVDPETAYGLDDEVDAREFENAIRYGRGTISDF